MIDFLDNAFQRDLADNIDALTRLIWYLKALPDDDDAQIMLHIWRETAHSYPPIFRRLIEEAFDYYTRLHSIHGNDHDLYMSNLYEEILAAVMPAIPVDTLPFPGKAEQYRAALWTARVLAKGHRGVMDTANDIFRHTLPAVRLDALRSIQISYLSHDEISRLNELAYQAAYAGRLPINIAAPLLRPGKGAMHGSTFEIPTQPSYADALKTSIDRQIEDEWPSSMYVSDPDWIGPRGQTIPGKMRRIERPPYQAQWGDNKPKPKDVP